MLRFIIRTGDGNDGCLYRESIEAPDWDHAIKVARERYCIEGEEYNEDAQGQRPQGQRPQRCTRPRCRAD